MFYSQFILAKKGPLGTIWIAAHLERKLRKNQVADTDIGVSVDSILFPDVPIALRLSSHLLLGVVRIYSRQVGYLFDDCSDALLKVKQAFRSAAVDLPPEESTAPYHSITLPETFDLDDFELPDNEIFQGNYVDRHISAREQITLQDTMDGVVFSTSQYGLDERFGDGDTSHINLDIDEELLLGKTDVFSEDGVSGANVEESVQPISPCDEDEIDVEMIHTSQATLVHSSENQSGGLSTIAEFHEYAQAPSTPGLVEEQNLPSIQKALANDDHLEVEDPNSTELVTTESAKNASSEPEYHNADTDGARCSLCNDSNHGAIECMPPEENGYHPRDAEIEKEKFEEGCQPDLVKSIPSKNLDGIGTIEVSNVEHYAPMPLVDQTVGECADSTIVLEQAATSPNCAHLTSDFKKSYSPDKTVVLDEGADVNLHMKSHPAIRKEATFKQMHVLMPCSQLDASSLRGEEQTVTGDEIEEGSRKLDGAEDNTIPINDPSENTKSLATSDFPEPERLLSVPEDLHDKASGLLIASTPEKEALEEGDGLATGSELISGRKRSFTESTITVESINSVETFGLTRFKRTAESTVPNDDDLLSSILGGRTTFLKIRPTPPVCEVTSLKRTRSTQRPSASKRKVPMDDTMVLHGDTIRQQLMNTEDIRRMRKKAPCTCPEVLMIQRQFLEDEIFVEPVFTGMSAQLMWLHREEYELSGIKISENDEKHTSTEVAMDLKGSILPNATECTEQILGHDVEAHPAEGSAIPNANEYTEQNLGHDIEARPAEGSVIPNATEHTEQNLGHDIEAHRLESSLQCENQPGNEFLAPPNFDTDGHINSFIDVAEPRNSQHETLGVATEMEIDTTRIEPANADNLHKTDGFQENHASCLSADWNIDAQPVSEEMSFVDTGDVKGSNEPNVGDMAMVENELEDANKILLGDGEAEIKADSQIDRHPSALIDNGEQLPGQIENNMGEILNEDGVLAPNVNFYSKDPTPSSGEPTVDFQYSEELCADAKLNSLNVDDENSFAQKVDTQSDFNTEIGGFDPMEERGGFQNIEVEHDTGFLNVDDDDLVEEDDGGIAGADEPRLLDNTGWSSRTRAVAKYLQILFEKEAVQCRKAVLPMDSLLAGKTRKEASRMFFETLVLKTKDYIQVEQVTPFDNINIKPKGKQTSDVFT